MSLPITLTIAGRAALVNADNTGTQKVLVATIGVTATAFVAEEGQTAVPGEIKRLSSIAGLAVASDTIHVTLRDDSTDIYSLRGFGLYLDDGTLLALHGQATTILEKSQQAMLLLSADLRFVQINVASITFGDTSFANPPASTEVPGVVTLSTPQQAATGTDHASAVPPSALKYALDQRFGDGAPSSFVKSLLALATAALMRTALGLGNASLRNEGHGNGLDADKLDGQEGSYYRSYANLTNVPTSFVPSAHAHDAGAITSGTLANARIAQSNVTQHQAALAIAYSQLTGVPLTFTPTAHNQDANTITSGTLDAARIPTLALTKTSGLAAALDAKAPLVSPQFTGVPAAVDGQTQIGGSAGNYIRIRFDGAIAINSATVFNTLWHSGNFNPANKQNTLGYTPIQQGTGVGQATNVVKIGWTGSGLALTVDSTDFGHFAFANYTEATYAKLSGANFTGAVTAPLLSASSSDARLKRDIRDLQNCLQTILRLRPRAWRWIESGEEDSGFLGQEHRDNLPGSVHEDDAGMLFVRYGKAEPYLVGAVHTLHARLEKLEAGR